MNNNRSFNLSLTLKEIEWILLQINAPMQRLYSSPFQGKSTEYIQHALEEAKSALLDRGLVVEQAETTIALDATCAALVGALGYANVIVRLDIFSEQDPTPHAYQYFNAESLIVEQSPADNGAITLTALRDLDVLRDRLNERLGLQNQEAPREGSFQCAEQDFADIPYILAGDGQSAAITELVQLGADQHFASNLARAMKSPLQQTTLQIARINQEQTEGVSTTKKLMLLEGIYGLWAFVCHLEKESPDIEIIPCDASQAKQHLDALLEDFIL
jgi:hypothetical protein